jgi:hypothetical protein
MLHLLRRCPLVAALVFLPGCRPAHSQPARVQQPVPVWHPTINFVIPDKKFVTNACADIEQEAKFYPKPTAAEVPPPKSSGLSKLMEWHDAQFPRLAYNRYQELIALCGSYAANSIDGDTWLFVADPLRLIISGAAPCEACRRAELHPTEPVPRGFKTYALFLIPSATWSEPNFREELIVQFQDFGDAIGNERAAIWLKSWNGQIDFNRSKDYADLFCLNYNDGPYVIVTSERPDEYKTGDKILLLKMNSISAERLKFVLNAMAQQVRLDNIGLSRVIEYEEIKQRILTFVSKHQDLVSEVLGKALEK